MFMFIPEILHNVNVWLSEEGNCCDLRGAKFKYVKVGVSRSRGSDCVQTACGKDS